MKASEAWRRLRGLMKRQEIEEELRAEMEEHVARLRRGFEAQGMTADEAARAARLRFGNERPLREESRATWGFPRLESIAQDLRFGARLLRRSPGFTVVAVLTLALGIGANTAMFSVMNAVVLASLPVQHPEQLVYLHTSGFPGGQTGYGDTSMRMQVYETLRNEKRVFSDLIAWVPLSLTGDTPARVGSQPEQLRADMVSGNFFTGLGVRPVQGRVFNIGDETEHAAYAVLSYDYWTRRFDRSSTALGQTIYLKGVPFTIVGVAAPSFEGLDQGTSTQVWIPLQTNPYVKPWGSPSTDKHDNLYGSAWWYLLTIGRLQPNVSGRQALEYLQPIFRRAAYLENPEQDDGDRPPQLSFTDARGMEGLRKEYEKPLRILMAMALLVLVIACANVAMLLLARNAARQGEFSVRLALGSSRMRLFRQLLTESAILVASGAALGWAFSVWATRLLATWSLVDRSLAPDRTVLGFTAAVSVLSALAFGLAPLRQTVEAPMAGRLKTAAPVSRQNRDSRRGGQVVLVVQIAFCLVLLIGAGLLVRTLRNLEKIDTGMQPDGLLVFGISPQQHATTAEQERRFYQSLLEKLRQLPGITSATAMVHRIGGGWTSNTLVFIDGQEPRVDTGRNAIVRWNAVGPDYLRTLGVPVLRGRDFNDGDAGEAPRVAIVNETFVKRYLADSSPLGRQVEIGMRMNDGLTIVGVAADSKYKDVWEPPLPMAYIPFTQAGGQGTMQFEVRTAGPPAAFWPEVRGAVRNFAPDLPLLDPLTQEEQFAQNLSEDRLVARLAMFFGALAVVLVATGLYGTLAYKVARRTPEIGVRMALGARPTQVVWLVVRESLALGAIALALGLPAGFALARLMSSMLFGVRPGDPGTTAISLVTIMGVMLAASAVPAVRAARVDPMMALRNE